MPWKKTASYLPIAIVLAGILSDVSCQRNPIREALFLGNETLANGTAENCIWRRGGDSDRCPDPDIFFILYTPTEPTLKQPIDIERNDWLRGSSWEPALETIFIIHGYAGGDDTVPIIVLRDAYLRTKRYNVIMVDWGRLCRPPCYVAAVHNLRAVAKCTAQVVARLQGSGMPLAATTCVGHSLGAHVCGIMSNYLPFRIHRIIGLDPARPLIRSSAPLRLDAGDANSVQVLHTNAGKYGEGGRLGHLDICINGGRSQPFCLETQNEALCSHIWSICYQAESLFKPRTAEPCGRRCPVGSRPSISLPGSPLHIGQAAPITAAGTYCVSNNFPPFCPEFPGDIGDDRCCLTTSEHAGAIKNKTRYKNPIFLDAPYRKIKQLELRRNRRKRKLLERI